MLPILNLYLTDCSSMARIPPSRFDDQFWSYYISLGQSTRFYCNIDSAFSNKHTIVKSPNALWLAHAPYSSINCWSKLVFCRFHGLLHVKHAVCIAVIFETCTGLPLHRAPPSRIAITDFQGMNRHHRKYCLSSVHEREQCSKDRITPHGFFVPSTGLMVRSFTSLSCVTLYSSPTSTSRGQLSARCIRNLFSTSLSSSANRCSIPFDM